MKAPLLLIIFLISIVLSTANTFLVEVGNTCSDPEYDTCIIRFIYDSITNETETTTTISQLSTWLSSVSSIDSINNSCTASSDNQSLIISPQALPKDQFIVQCTFYLFPNANVVGVAPTEITPVTFPPLIYFQYPFQLTTLSSSCRESSSNQDCQAKFQFPIASLPFALHTTSTITLDSFQCISNTQTSITSQINILLRSGTDSQTIRIYDFSISSPESLINLHSITCTGSFSKSPLSPHFRIFSPTNTLYYQSTAIVYSPLQIGYSADCSDVTTNTCTLIYDIGSNVPDWSDLRVFAPGFAQQLTHPYECLNEITTTRNICQKWRKYLTSSTEAPTSIKSNQQIITFFGTYFSGTKLKLEPTQIIYTTPLKFVFNTAQCSDISKFTCPLTISSTYTGPAVRISFTLPYSGTVETTNCTEFMTYTLGQHTLNMPKPSSGKQFVPHPADYYKSATATHSCTLNIPKVPFSDRNVPSTTHPIILYEEYLSPPITLFANTSALQSFAIPMPFMRVPFTKIVGSNCMNTDVEWCDLHFKLSDDAVEPLRSFQFSVTGIVNDLADEDYSLTVADASLNSGSISLSVEPMVWNFPRQYSSFLPITHNCRESTVQICLPPPNGGQQGVCEPPCDYEHPDDPDNPCTPCVDQVSLFSINIVGGEVKSPFTFRFRKQVWRKTYKNLMYIYSYGSIKFDHGIRFGDGDGSKEDGSPRTDNNLTVVVQFFPPYAVQYVRCDDPNSVTCYAVVSRRDQSTKDYYFFLDRSEITTPLDTISLIQVFNDTSGEYQEIGTTPIPPYVPVLDIPVPFSKQFGMDKVLLSRSYEVAKRNITDPKTNQQVEQIYFNGEVNTFKTRMVFDRDGYPVFDDDCDEISSETCTVTYTFQSFVTVLSFTPGAVPKNLTLIEHQIPSNLHIHSMEFTGFDPTVQYYGTTTDGFSRNYTNFQPLRYAPTCLNTFMDVDSRVAIQWNPNFINGQQQTVGSIALVLINGEYPLGTVCKVKMYKRATLTPSTRILHLPTVMFNQTIDSYRYAQPSHWIRFPPIQYSRMLLRPHDDCTTQSDNRVVCTMVASFFATERNQLHKLNVTVPPTISHPLIPVSDKPYLLYASDEFDDTKLVGHIDIRYTTPPPSGGYRHDDDDDDNGNAMSILQQAPLPNRSLNIILYDGYQAKNSVAYLRLYGSTTRTPVPFPAFNFPFFLNGIMGSTKTMPYIIFPSSITGVVFKAGFNVTYSHEAVRVDYTFFHNGLTRIRIDQDFGAYDEPIACYNKTSVLDSSFISRELFEQRYSDEQFKPLGFITSDRETGQSELNPIDPLIMLNQTCYTYLNLTSKSQFRVRHTISTQANGAPAFDIQYFTNYPLYSTSGTIHHIDSSDVPGSKQGINSAINIFHFNFLLIILLNIIISIILIQY